jgi:ribonuclease III
VTSTDPESLGTLEALEVALGYRFRDRRHLETALTHRSFANEQAEPIAHNERLEFLGDAVMSLVVGHFLMERFPNWSEGELSKARARLVSEAGLADLAQSFDLGSHLRLGRGENRTGGRTKPSLLADTTEAVVAALFLDAGFDATQDVLRRWFSGRIASVEFRLRARDAKTALQELVQGAHRHTPTYALLEATGPDHEKRFTVVLCVEDRPVATGTGHSKKDAEQNAAAALLARLEEGEPIEAISLSPKTPSVPTKSHTENRTEPAPGRGSSPGGDFNPPEPLTHPKDH